MVEFCLEQQQLSLQLSFRRMGCHHVSGTNQRRKLMYLAYRATPLYASQAGTTLTARLSVK